MYKLEWAVDIIFGLWKTEYLEEKKPMQPLREHVQAGSSLEPSCFEVTVTGSPRFSASSHTFKFNEQLKFGGQ